MRRVALIAAIRDGLILFGKREDNGRFTLPGGHLEEGEDWEDGARRELKEETGLEAKGKLEFVSEQERGDLTLRLYTCEVDGIPTGADDPDQECRLWCFMDHAEGIPKAVAENMQGPKDPEKNIVIKEFGLGKTEEWEPPHPDDYYSDSTHLNDQNFYHGTPHRFDNFELKPGYNTTTLTEAAPIQRHGFFFSSNPRFSAGFTGGPRGRIIEAKLRHGSVLNLNSGVPSNIAHHFEEQGLHDTHRFTPGGGGNMKPWQLFDGDYGKKAVQAMKNAGYHSAFFDEDDPTTGEEGRTHVVFHPDQIQQIGSGLKKMAISKIPVGASDNDPDFPEHNYDHVLTPKHKAAGYQIRVQHTPGDNITAFLSHNSDPGTVLGRVRGETYTPGTITPHSNLDRSLRGQGLGQAMYEAVYAHAFHNGIKKVKGHEHSDAASSVHRALSSKHGLNYEPEYSGDESDSGNVGGYRYAIKNELKKTVSPEFEKWFSGSKAVGDDGRPLRLFHGTAPTGHSFKPGAGFGPSALQFQGEDFDTFQTPSYFTTSPEYASGFAQAQANERALGNGARVHPVHVSIKNPYDARGDASYWKKLRQNTTTEVARLKSLGHDGVVMHETAPDSSIDGGHIWVAFHPHQIKSVSNVRPTDHPAMNKAEEHDEVDRLLKHPDPVERRLALKLGSVGAKHLIRAMQDQDPEVQREALNHPGVNHDVLTALMGMQDRDHLQLRALGRPDIKLSHLKKLYDTHQGNNRLVNAITHHPDLDGDQIDKMYEDGKASRSLIANLNTNPDTIKKIIERHFAEADTPPGHRHLVIEALKHPHAPGDLVDHALKNGDEGIRLAAAQSPNLPEASAHDLLARGQHPTNSHEAFLRFALAASKHATEKHLDMALEDQHPRVRAGVFATASDKLMPKHVARAIKRGDATLAAMAMRSPVALPEHAKALLASKDPELQALGQHYDKDHQEGLKKYQDSLGTWMGSKSLTKATDPKHFSGILRASDAAGRDLVDHTPHLESHPAEHTPLVQAYREHVLNSPKTVKKLSPKRNEGITRKHLYTIPASVQSHGGQTFMVKPYHERIIGRVKNWQEHPHQGWAEMAHQGLYHAAGIGDLHQKVHVSEHNMGEGNEKEPALVVAMEKDHRSVGDLGHFASHYAGPELADQARKISIMDMLTNNLDRHSGNLMMHFPGGFNPAHVSIVRDDDGKERVQQKGTKADKLLAIDHSRSFQYKNTHQNQGLNTRNIPALNDSFGDYHYGSAQDSVSRMFNMATPSAYDRKMQTMRDYAPTFEWWGEQSPKVRAAMDKHLAQIKDPKVRAHIKRNFDARADWLDERANLGLENYSGDWYKDPIPMYRPGELTDEENDKKHWYKTYGKQNMTPEEDEHWKKKHGHLIDF